MEMKSVDADEVAIVSTLEGRPEVTLILMNEGVKNPDAAYVSVFVNGEYLLEVEIPKMDGDVCFRVGENRVLDAEEADDLGVSGPLRGSLATSWDNGDRLLTSGEGSGFAVATDAMKKRNPDWDVPPYDE